MRTLRLRLIHAVKCHGPYIPWCLICLRFLVGEEVTFVLPLLRVCVVIQLRLSKSSFVVRVESLRPSHARHMTGGTSRHAFVLCGIDSESLFLQILESS